ncbi:hypothetical protein [Streptomyces sp. PsTaAH-124]|uniref:hypothetical protein n=1 Tax=Streptomyces sp. PsTaAH-124 TaxID=1157638 RepID=UPI000363C3F2|nr:hypothetical protein [Streptomyces sp. PsTaAH-124]
MIADSPDEPTGGEDYVAPEDRAAEWSRMAGELAASGYSEAEVAQALAIDEETVERLLGGQQR